MFAMSTAINTLTFVLTALFYALWNNLMCDCLGYSWVTLEDTLAPVAYPIQAVTTTELTNEPDVSRSAHPDTPISSPTVTDPQPRLLDPLTYKVCVQPCRSILAPVLPKPKTTPTSTKSLSTPPKFTEPAVSFSIQARIEDISALDPTHIPLPASPQLFIILSSTEQLEEDTTNEGVTTPQSTTSKFTLGPVPAEPGSVLVPQTPARPSISELVNSSVESALPFAPSADLHTTLESTTGPAPALAPLADIPRSSPSQYALTPTVSEATETTSAHAEDAHSTSAEPALPILSSSIHATPFAPTTSPQPTNQALILGAKATVDVPARAPILAARPDLTVTKDTQGSACNSVAPLSIDALTRLFRQMSIEDSVEHEMKDWIVLHEMDTDKWPTVSTVGDLLKEIELGMWDSVQDMERWSTTEVKGPAVIRNMRAASMSSPTLEVDVPGIHTSPMVLDVQEDLDTVMEPLNSHSCVHDEMETDWEFTHVTVDAQVSEMDGMSNSWVGPTSLDMMAPSWTMEGYASDVHMEDSDMSTLIEFEWEEMGGAVEG